MKSQTNQVNGVSCKWNFVKKLQQKVTANLQDGYFEVWESVFYQVFLFKVESLSAWFSPPSKFVNDIIIYHPTTNNNETV